MLKQIQAVTGLIFGLFVALHLANTWFATLGPGAYDEVQGVLRTFYQFAPFEVVFLAALSVHLISGVLGIAIEPARSLSVRARWQRYAGFFMALVIGGHIMAVRGPSWFYDVGNVHESEFAVLTMGIAREVFGVTVSP